MKYLQERQLKVLEWAPQSPGLDTIENLWRDLKHAVYARRPKNISKLELFCHEVQGEIPKARIERLLAGYRKYLQVVIVAFGGVTKF